MSLVAKSARFRVLGPSLTLPQDVPSPFLRRCQIHKGVNGSIVIQQEAARRDVSNDVVTSDELVVLPADLATCNGVVTEELS